MRHLVPCVIALAVAAAVVSAQPLLITFEDQWPSAFEDPAGTLPWRFISSPYAGLDWAFLFGDEWVPYLMVVARAAYPDSGYQHVINGEVGVATPWAANMTFGGQVFSVHSLRAGSAWKVGMYAFFVGTRDGQIVRSERLALPYEGVTLTLNYTGIDSLQVYPDTSSGVNHHPPPPDQPYDYGHQVVMDDILVTIGSALPPPVAAAGPDQVVEQTSPAGAAVTLDGSASTGAAPLAFAWSEGAVPLGAGAVLTVPLGPGAHTLTLTVTAGDGQTATDEVAVTVQDTTPPQVAILSPEPGATYYSTQGAVPVTGDVSDLADPAPLLDWTLDGAPFMGAEILLGSLPPGAHVLRLTATDSAGNHATALCPFDVTAEPLAGFCVKHLILQWARGGGCDRDTLDLQAALRLPPGYRPCDLTGELRLLLATPAAEAPDAVVCDVRGNGDWAYGHGRSSGRGLAPALALTQVLLNWERCRPEGALNLSGLLRRGLFEDGSGQVRIGVVLPVRGGGELAATVELDCRVRPNHWQFIGPRDGRWRCTGPRGR